MTAIRLTHIRKNYDNGHIAVKDFNLTIDSGEFIVFVGPSGCGKSTTLRMIAGLEAISSGDLHIGDRLVNDLEPKERDIAMVFQNYALYPHMTVRQNMAFALKMKGVAPAEIAHRVNEVAKMMQLEALLERRPKELSGGQRQRVALGRAVVRRPAAFLMDEPLSNLDAKLRGEMRASIAKLHRTLGVTTVYVTHDQVEAMTMADRIVVMKDGEIQQIASPIELYNRPHTRFVGSFIGSPAMSFLPAQIKGGRIEGDGFSLTLPPMLQQLKSEIDGKTVELGLRPESLGISGHTTIADSGNRVAARIDAVELLGAETLLTCTVSEMHQVVVRVSAQLRPHVGDEVTLLIETVSSHIFDKESGKNLAIPVWDKTAPSSVSEVQKWH